MLLFWLISSFQLNGCGKTKLPLNQPHFKYVLRFHVLFRKEKNINFNFKDFTISQYIVLFKKCHMV